MWKTFDARPNLWTSTFCWLSVVLLIILLTVAEASAQSSGSSVTDGSTPLGLTPGSPAGSYALSGFENVNPYNGNLNFVLPLLSVGGRGAIQHTIPLKIEQHWRTIKTQQTQYQQPYYYPTPNFWQGIAAGYSPGAMTGRVTGVADMFSCPESLPSLTRLTFTAGDGTEYEFRDVLFDGLEKENFYSGDPTFCDIFLTTSRGRVFTTFDGSAMTFISDTDISDFYGRDIKQITDLFGYMFLRDGTRYRIELGRVLWIQDRNGNRMTFHYNTFSDVDIITDSLNRTVTIHYSYEYIDPDPHALYDEVNYKGFGRADRSLKVWYKKLKDCLRVTQPGDSISTWKYNELFPEIQWVDGDNKYNAWKVSSVELPDGRQYQLYYNVYGELARVVLPTGGAFEYDYRGGLPNGPDSGAMSGINIYRRVIERRVYTDGAQLENRTTFERPADDGVTAEISVTVEQYNNGAALLARSRHFYHGSPQASFLWSITRETHYSKWQDGKEWKTESFDTDSTIKQRVTNNWVQRYGSSATDTPPNDPRIADTTTKLMDTSQVSQQVFSYDQYNNKTEVDEYDFGANTPGPLKRRTHTNYLTTNIGYNYTTVNPNTTNPDPNATIHLRSLALEVLVYDADDLVNPKARTTYEYDNYTAGLTDRPTISNHGRNASPPSATASYLTRGNPTQVTKWLLPSTPLSTRMQYDIAGNAVSVTDPKNNPPTVFDFSDRYGVPDSEARDNSQYKPELGSQSTYAFATLVTNSLGHTSYTQYDYYLGKPVNGEDANGAVVKGRYDDALDRGTEVVVAENIPALKRRTLFTYNDALHLITTSSDQTSYSDGLLKSEIVYDGLGRTTESRQYESTSAYISTDQHYDGLGRVVQTSNPYRPGLESQWLTSTIYDGLGRVKTVTTPDNAVVTTTYLGNATTVRDQANKQRRSFTDALGRLTSVDEMYEYPSTSVYATTTYGYDVLDDLKEVTQAQQNPPATQIRTFVYDSLKRLTRATNPESGIIQYTYDGNSNLQTKVDARSITTAYAYDALDRVISRTYTNDPQNTPAVSYKYDAQTLPNGFPAGFNRGFSTGRLVAVTYGGTSAGNYTGYDQVGRANISYQQTDSQNYGFGYGYNIAGEMTAETYPSGRVIQSEYDTAGRLAGVKNQATQLYYAGATSTDATNRIQYASHGAVSVMKLGNGKWEHTTYDQKRLQPMQIGLGTSSTDSSLMKLDYNYGATTNNGNVQSQTLTGAGLTLTQCYGYDALNRLLTAEERSGTDCSGTQQWKQAFSYDRFGNRNFDVVNTTANVLGPNPTINQSNNRIATGQNYDYDFAGNLTSDPATPPNGTVYDAENRQTQYTATGQPTNYYNYDGDGRRVKKIDSSGTTVLVYNAGGLLIAEYHSDQVPPAAGGGGTSYLTSDHLGSTRVVTKSDGTVKARYDYLPFGEELGAGIGGRTVGMGYSAADSTKQKFTSKERDNESGLDYFGARYYSSAQGRFTSPDEFAGGPHDVFILGSGHSEKQALPYADIAEPQGLNKYQYCLNNPLRYIDPDGHQQGADNHDQVISFLVALKGASVHAGTTLAHDGRERRLYSEAARDIGRRLEGESAKLARNLAKFEARQKMTALGRTISEAADKSRVGQLEGKTAAELSASAGKTSNFWNKVGEVSEAASKPALALGVGISVYYIANAPEGQTGQAVANEVGGWGGAIVLGQTGAEVGAAIGGPPGAAVGGILGGIAGAVGGTEWAKSGFKLPENNLGSKVGPNGQRELVK